MTIVTSTPAQPTGPVESPTSEPVADRAVAAGSGSSRGAEVLGSWPEGVVLPPYSPWRRIPAWEPQGLWLRDRPQIEWPDTLFSVTYAPWLLRLMLVVGLALGQATMGGDLGRHLLAVALTAVLWGWIEWWQTWDLTSLGRRLAVLGVQLVLIAGIIVICPLGGLIIWTHYMICGTFFTGPWLLATLVASCVLITAIQVGGFDRLAMDLTLSSGLFTFDLAIGIVAITLANRREEVVLRRNEITRRLLIEQQKNEDLHDQLMDQARAAATREERARLARDLHDTVAQGLVAVVTQLEAIPDNALTDAAARRRVDNAKALAREGLGEARRAVNALRPAALDRGSLVQAVGRMLDEWSKVHGVAATVTVSGEARATAADADLIRVVQEALSNVARHARAHRVTISVDYSGDEVLLDIHDDGVGFDPKCTAAPTATGGHGLPGMRERLRAGRRQSCGGIRARRRFRRQRGGAGMSALPALAPVRVIVVDDHPVVRDGIRGMLERDQRIDVVGEAAEGKEAVALVRRADPDLVLMDLRMPGGDGVTAIRELRAANRERPRILVLTTYDTDRDIYAAIDAGADGYLLKATSREELVDAVLRAAAGQSVLAPSAARSLVDRTRGEHLTERELQVLSAIAHGGTNRDVARELLVSEATVKTHLLRIYPKLGVRDRAAAVRVAFERGLLGSP